MSPSTGSAGAPLTLSLTGTGFTSSDAIKFVSGTDCTAAGVSGALAASPASSSTLKYVSVQIGAGGTYTACVLAPGATQYAALASALALTGAWRVCVPGQLRCGGMAAACAAARVGDACTCELIPLVPACSVPLT